MVTNDESKFIIKRIVVVGDTTEDRLILENEDPIRNLGGAFFVSQMLGSVVNECINEKLIKPKVVGYDDSNGNRDKLINGEHLHIAKWKIASGSDNIIRCSGTFSSSKNFDVDVDVAKITNDLSQHPLKLAEGDKYQMVVIQDLRIDRKGFMDRRHPDPEGKNLEFEWVLNKDRLALDYDTNVPQIFLMINRSLPDFENFNKNTYWKCLFEEDKDEKGGVKNTYDRKTLAVLYANTLRFEGLDISEKISWERTAQTFLEELYKDPAMKRLGELRHLVVRFGTSGAIYSYHIGKRRFHRLFFDPKAQTIGGHRDVDVDGDVIGNQSIFVTSIIQELIESVNTSNNSGSNHLIYNEYSIIESIGKGVSKAIRRCQKHFDEGLGLSDKRDEISKHIKENRFGISFFKPDYKLNEKTIADERIPMGNLSWSILNQSAEYDLLSVGCKVVLEGIDNTFNNIKNNKRPIWAPIVEFGKKKNNKKLTVIDRIELESYQAVYRIISHAVQSKMDRPLSIAVFGPPGSGKSFVVNSILDSVKENSGNENEYSFHPANVAQWTKVDDFKAVIDEVKKQMGGGDEECNKVPLVFLDEFDCDFGNNALGWLKYFLEPMENAERYLPESKGAKRYPVFIFAGGTSHTYRDFTREDTSITENQRADFATAKGPDFVSRLSGHINILGPDPLDDYDEAYILRRAVFLRSLMINRFNVGPKEDIKKRIDQAIICALLTVTSYKHGMRSLRAILSMSSKLGDDKDGKIVISTLPSLSQLNMHVDGNEFLARVSEYKKKE